MYEKKEKSYAVIALTYYFILLIAFVWMGILLKDGVKSYYWIYWSLFIVAILIVWIKDKSFVNLGFTKEKLKSNLLISFGMILSGILIVIAISDLSIGRILKATCYYLFYIAMVEEVLFRGFIQSYLFGFSENKKLIYCFGGICFALMHLPFQMYVHNNVSISYVIQRLPSLFYIVILHLLFCYITSKRKDITIPIAFHFLIDFLQDVL